MATTGQRRTKTISARELKNKTGDALRAVGRHERVVVTRHGKPYAALIPIDELPKDDVVDVDAFWESIREESRKNPLPLPVDEMIGRSRRRWPWPLSSIPESSSSTRSTRKTRGRR